MPCQRVVMCVLVLARVRALLQARARPFEPFAESDLEV